MSSAYLALNGTGNSNADIFPKVSQWISDVSDSDSAPNYEDLQSAERGNSLMKPDVSWLMIFMPLHTLSAMPMFYNLSHQPTKSIKEAKCQNKYSSKTSRAPFTVLAQNSHNINNLPYQNDVGNVKFGGFAPNNKVQGIFLKKDNPRCHINTKIVATVGDIAWKDAKYGQIWEYLRDEFELTQRFASLDFNGPTSVSTASGALGHFNRPSVNFKRRHEGKVSAAGNSRRNGIRDMSQQNMRSILAEKARKVICKKLDEWKKDHATIIALHQTQPKSLIFSSDSLQ
ncbi:hypothetical protein KIW84_071727 [Lathyrus oleraceus]|uniref:Uncharacterized protein n=1 Tax=Pisum sativum TaxID=3888 RepID=A0A9D4VLD0_PEA|nr:hypothetical protein KIW84_071726 [Pisum sativum]KAI5384857.1 hypothetical protein KIW84_071727 [Pisum sativum]